MTGRWEQDVLGPDYRVRTLELAPDDEGDVVASLVRYVPPSDEPVRPARGVLYVHGWSDYFFQTELAEYWHGRGIAFYALDLRKYGRSLREHQTPGYIDDLETYDEEIDASFAQMRRDLGRHAHLTFMGHSTGGLIAALWADRHPGAVRALVLNSPWLELQGSSVARHVSSPAIAQLARFQPKTAMPNIDPGYYARTLRKVDGGEWDYDDRWRPSPAFPVRAGWLRAVIAGHARVARGLDIDQPAQMLYTSGTSGNPKGVPLTYRNVGVNGRDWLVCNAPLIEEGDRDLLWLPMSHIFGFGELCLGNLLGWETYMATPADVLDLLPGVAPQVFMSVPAYWEKIARAIGAGGDPHEALTRVTGGRLRFCLSGGAGLKVEIKQTLHQHGLLIIEGYGLTETSPTLTLNRPDAFRFDTVGKVLPSVELKLADDGEILARGENVFSGYYKDPNATAAAFTEDGWFCTGDVGRWTADGFLQIVDRKKDILVNSGGKNIPPANIEAA